MNQPHFFNVDERRKLMAIQGTHHAIQFMADHWVAAAKEAIFSRGKFFVALSGGKTPQAIYSYLARHHVNSLDWSKVVIFFSDERAVSPESPDSNYGSALQAGLRELAILPTQIFRMEAESSIAANAFNYERCIVEKVPHQVMDLVMLGMGDDGHTASLFPETEAVKIKDRLVVQNYIPKLDAFRMTFTLALINKARQAVFYVIGKGKQEMVKTVLTSRFSHEKFPSSLVGTKENPALWIVDGEADPSHAFIP
jgi:6-phosphogluconolactonase